MADKTSATLTETTPAPAAESKRQTIAELVTDLANGKPHGKDVNFNLVERFMPLLDKVKGINKIRLALLLHFVAESFPKHVWTAIAETGDPTEITKRVRVAIRAMQREKSKLIASVTDAFSTDLDLLYLAVDERQYVPGKMAGAEWVANFLNIVPDKKTQGQIALLQLDPSRAKIAAAATPDKK